MKELDSLQKDKWVFSVMSVSMFGVRFIKKINVIEKYQVLVKNQKSWFDKYAEGKTEMMPNLEYQINDNLDVMVKITVTDANPAGN